MARLGQPYWWDDGAPLPDLPEKPPANAELLIVGAGFTGLSAAITARRAGAQVVVVDSGVPGQGASTRNGGMCGAHSRVAFDEMVKSFGADVAARVFAEMPNAFAYTKSLIEDEAIDCGFQVTGRIQLATTRRHVREFETLAATLKREAGYDAQIVGRDSLGDHIGSDHYLGGLYYHDHAGLQPRQFHDGLMAVALREGVTIVQNCPVASLQKAGAGFEAVTRGGIIRAQRAILATNGYTRRPFGWFTRRVFPLPSFIIATQELTPERLNRLAPGGRMMVETHAKHSYYRLSPDKKRIIFGGRAGMVPYGPQFAARRLRRTMLQIWPELADVEITHSWRGYTGFTHEHTPNVGCHDGVYYAMGYSGSGVAMAPYLGMKAAYQALGDARGDTAFSETTMATRPYHPGGWPWFLVGGEIWYRQIVDRIEAHRARKDRAGHNG